MMTLKSHCIDRYLPFSSQSSLLVQQVQTKKSSGNAAVKNYKSSVTSRTGTVLSTECVPTNQSLTMARGAKTTKHTILQSDKL